VTRGLAEEAETVAPPTSRAISEVVNAAEITTSARPRGGQPVVCNCPARCPGSRPDADDVTIIRWNRAYFRAPSFFTALVVALRDQRVGELASVGPLVVPTTKSWRHSRCRRPTAWVEILGRNARKVLADQRY